MDYARALWELEQIKRLKARYYRLQDQNRWDEWAQLFTEDCEVADPIDASVTLHGRDAVAERTAQLAAVASRAHRGTMPDLELVDEETARGTWALHCAATFEGDSGPTFALIYGYYTDEYRKDEDGQWRIHRMRYDNDTTLLGPDVD
jgi:ketosteroid isomerase-like protein